MIRSANILSSAAPAYTSAVHSATRSTTTPAPTACRGHHGGFFGSAWPWWRGGLVLGWFGPLFWPYAHYDLFDYVYWPYAYDDFWPYAYDDVYYGIYEPTREAAMAAFAKSWRRE
jgi:hypothetical protein